MVKTYKLSDGLQESLLAFLASKFFDTHVADWKEQVTSCVIDEFTLEALLSMGQVSSKRDSRLTLVEAE